MRVRLGLVETVEHKEAIERATPVLKCMGTDTYLCGGPGTGHAMKMTNNLLATTIMIANTEALAIGIKAGLTPELMQEVMRTTGNAFRVVEMEDATREMPRGQPGELMYSGPLVMMGYHNNAAATAETVRPDGWLHTGDIAIMDEDGYATIVDRRSSIVRRT